MPTAKHAHSFDKLSAPLRVTLGADGRYTFVVLLACDCGAFDVFPRENYALTTPAFRDAVDVVLTALGCYLIPDAFDAARQN